MWIMFPITLFFWINIYFLGRYDIKEDKTHYLNSLRNHLQNNTEIAWDSFLVKSLQMAESVVYTSRHIPENYFYVEIYIMM